MANKRLKIVIIVLWILGTLLLSLPTFSFNIGDQNVKVDYSDRLARKLGTTLGNFQRSSGTFDSKEVRANLTFTNPDLSPEDKQIRLLAYMNLINKRISISNLYDVKIRSQIKSDNSEYSLILTFPEYFNDPIKYTNWLTAQANINFITGDQSNPVQIDLDSFDVLGNINLDYLDTVGSHLVFKFANEKIPTLQQAFSATSQGTYFVMMIDSLPSYFMIQYDQYSNTNEELTRSLPTQAILINSTKEKNDYLNITRSYFLNEALEDSFSIDSEIQTNKALFKNISATFTAEMFIASAIVLAIMFFVKFKKFKFFKYISAEVIFILTFISALKVLSSNLSISFVVGFLFVYFLVNAILNFILEKADHEDEVKDTLRLVRDTSLFGFILVSIVYKIIPNLGIFADFIGVVLIGFMILFLMSILPFKYIFDLKREDLKLINIQLPKFRKTKNEAK